jgi:hypothetical protein
MTLLKLCDNFFESFFNLLLFHSRLPDKRFPVILRSRKRSGGNTLHEVMEVRSANGLVRVDGYGKWMGIETIVLTKLVTIYKLIVLVSW